jgi:hypothetical protein
MTIWYNFRNEPGLNIWIFKRLVKKVAIMLWYLELHPKDTVLLSSSWIRLWRTRTTRRRRTASGRSSNGSPRPWSRRLSETDRSNYKILTLKSLAKTCQILGSLEKIKKLFESFEIKRTSTLGKLRIEW